jgi:ectoine hydroxylase-related dioxygenase (phytanoyl-CoA dioxygenase family)
MIPLISFTPENGSTGFVPGTHKYIYDTANWNEAKPHTRTFFNDNFVQPSVPLGGLSCFYGNCMHSVMPNKTDDIRRAIIFRAIRQDALNEMERLGLG